MEEDCSSAVENISSITFLVDKVENLGNIFARAGLILVYSFIFSICIIGNLALILVVTLEWKGRLLSKFYLGNLAVANLFVAIFCIPQDLFVHLLERWIFGKVMCIIFHCVASLSHTASILSLLVVSLERYMVLVHAFKGGQLLTSRRMKVASLLVWLISAGSSLPQLFHSGLVRIPGDDKAARGETCVQTASMYNCTTSDTTYFIGLFVLPLAFMSAMYLRIGMHIRKSEKRRNDLIRNKFQSGVLFHDNSGPGARGNLGSASATVCNTLQVPKSCSCIASTYCRQMVPGSSHRPGIKRGGLRLTQVRCGKRQSLVRTLTFIFVTFALLNLPFQVGKFCVNFLPSFEMSRDLIRVISSSTFLLMYLNCAVNPILYILTSSRFQQSLRHLICPLYRACSRTSDCFKL